MGGKINVILDLDSTLICAEPIESLPKGDFSEFKVYNMDDYYKVFERPYLQEFLDFLFANFNVSIWTCCQ